MVSTDLTASIGLIWIGTFFFLVSIVGILDKQKLSKFWFALAICLSIIATTTSALGLLSWIIGALFLILRHKENKKNLLIWIGISIIIFSMYVVNIGDLEGRKEIDEIISFAGISWGLEYVSNPFSVKFLELKILIGVISIILLISVSVYLLNKRIRLAYPWILFGIIGILSTILTDLGRFGIRLPSENYFIIMSTFTQIGLLVVVSILFFEIKKSNHKKKNLITIIYIVFVVSQLILLSSAYFIGSQYVSNWDREKSNWLTCFDLPSNLEVCDNWNVFGDPLLNRESLEDKLSTYNYLIENKLSIFSNKEFFLDQEQKKNKLNIEWNELNEGSGVGEIETINGQNISNDSIILDNDFVNISGWIIGKNEKIDRIFLFVDREAFLSSSNIKPQLDTIKKFENKQDVDIKWNMTFLSGFLEKGCHNISIGGVYDDSKFMLDKEFKICKT